MIQIHTDTIAITTPQNDTAFQAALISLQEEKWQAFDIIIDLVQFSTIGEEELNMLKSFSEQLNAQQQTAVVVAILDTIDPTDHRLAVVPTVQEAVDYISFEQMQRDLGI